MTDRVTLCKFAAVISWTATLMLFGVVLAGPIMGEQRYDVYALGVLSAFIAGTATTIAALDYIVCRVVSRELRRNRECLAEGIASALADELEARGMGARLQRVF